MSLSLLCVTRGDKTAMPFLREFVRIGRELACEVVICADGEHELQPYFPTNVLHYVRSKGYVESVLDEALEFTRGEYVLRMDDDERVSPAMLCWLREEKYREQPHWKFPRVHLWEHSKLGRGILVTPHLFPDHQTRLSVRSMAGGRTTIHAGSPHGGGAEAPCVIEHYKFLEKSFAERSRIAKTYDDFHAGYGTGDMLPFSLPERAYERAEFWQYEDGVMPLAPLWMANIRLSNEPTDLRK